MRVEACTDKIIRVRISANNNFKESLLERYEILKTDWQNVGVKQTEERNKITLSTGKYILSINKISGELSWGGMDGKPFVDNISLNLTDNKSKYSNFVQSLSKIYENGNHVPSGSGFEPGIHEIK